ncbi:MAG: hypothetical protein SWH78_16355 [Thermodesulfobacteriota bacterium]|nr:hypothetical protein [Thermodesulfobacteriota bacterium]
MLILVSLSIITAAIVIILVQRYRLSLKGPIWGDAFTYLKIALEIREQKRLPKHLDCYYTGSDSTEEFTLPPLLMVLLAPFSYFPYARVVWFPTALNLALVPLIFCSCVVLFDASFYQSLTAALLYLVTPMNANNSNYLTPRPLGLFFFFLFNISFSLYVSRLDIVYAILATLSLSLAFLSQRMVSQIVYICTPLLAVIGFVLYDSASFLLLLPTLVLALLLAILLSRGHFLSIVSDHFRRIYLHVKHGQQSTFEKRLGNPIQVLKMNPWVFFFIWSLYIKSSFEGGHFLFSGYATGTILLAIFWYLGNGINHIYFTTPFLLPFLAEHLFVRVDFTILMILGVVFSTWVILREGRVFRRKYISEDWLECFKFIAKMDLQGRVLVVPMISCSPILYYTDLQLVSSGHGSGAMSFNRLYLQKNISDNGFLCRFLEEHHVDFILLEGDFKRSLECSSLPLQRLFANQTLTLYQNGSV